MFPQLNNASNPEITLKQTQIEALKSLSSLLVREIDSLGEMQSNLEKKIEHENPISLLNELQHFEVRMIRCALIRTMGNQTRAARLLGLKKTTLHAKMYKYKIDLSDF